MMKRGLKLVILTCYVLIVTILGVSFQESMTAYATDKYITREEFVVLVMKELGFTVDESDGSTSYMEAAIRAGIISKSTFGTKHQDILSKSDAAVILVNADEYLNGKTVSDDLIEQILNERISDIDSVSKARKPYIAKAYALGYLTGSSNGIYTRDRSMKPWQKITTSTAKKLVSMIKDKSKRSKLTEDGQLIRTNNLPEFAEYYPYILDSFPNDYYDWEFMFMKYMSGEKLLYGTPKWVNLIDYATPIDFINYEQGKKIWYTYINQRKKISAKETYEISADRWQESAEKYLNLVFNVDYRKLKNDKDWYNGIISTDADYGSKYLSTEDLNNYVDAAIKNKTIVESKIVAVDKSSAYVVRDRIYIRAYVRYCITSSNSLERVGLSPIIYTRYGYPNLLNVKIGEWRDCYFDIEVSPYYENCGVYEAVINDYFHDVRVVTD